MPESTIIENIMPFGHAPNAIELPTGEIVLTWYCASYEGAEDQRIALAVRAPDGEWRKTQLLMGRFAYEGESWIPEISVPFLSPQGDLRYVVWACPLSSFRMSESTLVLQAASGGASFKSLPALKSEGGKVWARDIPFSRTFAIEIDAEYKASAPALFREERGLVFMGAARRLASGRQIIPYHTETREEWFRTRFLVSDGSQEGWESRADLYCAPGCLEPVIAEVEAGKILCLMRRGGYDGHIWYALSQDDGETFSEPQPTNLRNPHAGIDVGVSKTSGRLLIVYNDSYRVRTPLTVGISADGGKTFRTKDVETTPGSYAYPKLLQDRQGKWHLFYSENYLHIKQVSFDEAWLETGREVIGWR